jgi:urease accessory protein
MNATRDTSQRALEQEILGLEEAISNARHRLAALLARKSEDRTTVTQHATLYTEPAPSKHTLLLLADSALPLGSFAFSSGLESYLAHHKHGAPLPPFLGLAIDSLASTALPYVLAAYRDPTTLLDLDNDFDASTLCTVARRASVAQGRALLSVWERSFKAYSIASSNGSAMSPSDGSSNLAKDPKKVAMTSLLNFSEEMRMIPSGTFQVNGHIGPLWGAVSCSQGISLVDTAYVFLLNHAKAVVSAAVRASVLGPYAAQGLLASGWLRGVISDALRVNWDKQAEEAGQCAPVLDIWVGRHELLYSRIFNS